MGDGMSGEKIRIAIFVSILLHTEASRLFAGIPPELIDVIPIDPKQLPEMMTFTPSDNYCGPFWPFSIAWSLDNTRLAVGFGSGPNNSNYCPGSENPDCCPDSGFVQIFDITKKPAVLLYTLSDATEWVYSIAFNHDDSRLVAGGKDGMVRIYDNVEPPILLKTLSRASGAVKSIRYRPGGDRFAVGGSDGGVTVYDGKTYSPLYNLPNVENSILSLAYNNTGTRLAVGGKDFKVRIYDGSGNNQAPLLYTLADSDQFISSVAFNHDGSHLAVGSYDNKVRIYDGGNLDSPPRILTDATKWVKSIAYNHDGTLLATASYDGVVRIYDGGSLDTPPHNIPALFSPSWLFTVSWSRNSHRLAVGDFNQVRIYEWDETGAPNVSVSFLSVYTTVIALAWIAMNINW